MIAARTPRSGVWLLRAGAYLILLFIAVLVVAQMPASRRLWSALLLAAVAAPLGTFVEPTLRPAWVRAYLATQTLLVLVVYALHPPAALGVSQLFYLLTTQAALCLTLPEASAWAVLYAAVTVGGGVHVMGPDGAWGSIATGVGNLFFLGLGAALRQVSLADARSRRLLGELRAAHDRLQALSAQSQQLAVADERNRIAREMHDALGHRLSVAVVQLEGARRLMTREPGRAGRMIDSMRAELKAGLAELRATVAALRTPWEAPLSVTLGRLAAAFASATGLAVHPDLDAAADDLPAEQGHALYRAAQEALTNVQRHAHAENAWVTLEVGETSVTLTVQDDGRGFAAGTPEGFGLRGIEERARAFGGDVRKAAREGGGALVRVTLPLSPEALAEARGGMRA